VLLVIIPATSKILLEKLGVASVRKDLILTRTSVAFLAAGTLLLCISDGSFLVILSLTIFALGNGFVTLGKSLLMIVGPSELAGTLLSAMTMSGSLGAVLAGPLIAITFNWGLDKGGTWLGFPLFLVALLYTITLGFVCAIRIPDAKLVDDVNDNNDNDNDG
jgi:MFS family permease